MDDERPVEQATTIEDQARELVKNKEYAQALSLCEEAETDGLRSGELYAVHAIALTELKRQPEASALIDEKLKEYPTEPSLYYAQAFLKLRQKKPKDALAICDYAASIGVWNSKLAGAKSTALIMPARNKEALLYIVNELEKYPDESVLHYNLGVVYQRLKKKVESKQEYETALALDPRLGELRERNAKRDRAFRILVYGSLIYFLIGFLFLHASRYFLLPFWLLFIAFGSLGLYSALRLQHFKMASKALFFFLLGVSALFYLFTFDPLGTFGSLTNRLVMVVIILVALGYPLLAKRFRHKDEMTQPMPPIPPGGMPPQQQYPPQGYPPQGYPPPEKKPRMGLKILLGIVIGVVIVVVAISVFFLTGLKNGVDVAEEVGVFNTETHNGVIGEPVACGMDLEVTVYSAEECTNDYAISPADGYYFLALDLGFVNNRTYSEPLDPTLEMRIKDSEGKLYGHVNVGPEPLLPGGDIKGRTKVRGYVVFVVPGTANGLVFQFEPWQPFGDTALIPLD